MNSLSHHAGISASRNQAETVNCSLQLVSLKTQEIKSLRLIPEKKIQTHFFNLTSRIKKKSVSWLTGDLFVPSVKGVNASPQRCWEPLEKCVPLPFCCNRRSSALAVLNLYLEDTSCVNSTHCNVLQKQKLKYIPLKEFYVFPLLPVLKKKTLNKPHTAQALLLSCWFLLPRENKSIQADAFLEPHYSCGEDSRHTASLKLHFWELLVAGENPWNWWSVFGHFWLCTSPALPSLRLLQEPHRFFNLFFFLMSCLRTWA